MPIYEYRCLACGDVFAHLYQHFADAAEQEPCPTCGSEQTRRLLSTFAVSGKADPGPGRAAWPTAWNDTNGADPETLRYWRKRIEREARLEERYPELRDASRRGGNPADVPPPPQPEHGHSHHHHDHDHAHHAHHHTAGEAPGHTHEAATTPNPSDVP